MRPAAARRLLRRPLGLPLVLSVGAGAALAMVAAYTFGSAPPAPLPAAAGESVPAPSRTISLRGTGEVVGIPDQLTFRFSVVHRGGDVTTSLTRADAAARRVLTALAREGVARRDVQSTGLSIRPEYDYRSSGPPVLTGYVVTESASVLVRDLARAGAALRAVAEAGGNAVRVHGIGLGIGDREALLTRARDEAVATARDKAEQYAAATGQSLGGVLSLREVTGRPAPSHRGYARAEALDAAAGAVPIRAGSEEVRVTVSVVWQLE
jgi:uncharacterized protein YggE